MSAQQGNAPTGHPADRSEAGCPRLIVEALNRRSDEPSRIGRRRLPGSPAAEAPPLAGSPSPLAADL
jgi:hypothetical protein